MAVIAKFHVDEVAAREYNAEVKLRAVTPNIGPDGPEFNNDEDEKFWKATPNGILTMTIDNPAAAEQFQPGDDWYLKFEKASGDER